jgi:hypothetical protein
MMLGYAVKLLTQPTNCCKNCNRSNRGLHEHPVCAIYAPTAEKYSVVRERVKLMEKYAVAKSTGQIAIYQTEDGLVQLDVALEQNTV